MRKQKMLYVYIVKCSDDSYYIGVTNNWKKRLKEHNEGKDEESYTYSRRPVELMYKEGFSEFEIAMKRETQLKTWSKAKKEALIASDRKRLKELAECKNETTHKNHLKNSGDNPLFITNSFGSENSFVSPSGVED